MPRRRIDEARRDAEPQVDAVLGEPGRRPQVELVLADRAGEDLREQDAVVRALGLGADDRDAPVLVRGVREQGIDRRGARHARAYHHEPAPAATARRSRANRLEAYGGRLELRLARGGIDCPGDHAVQRAGAGREVERPPVERREGGAGRHGVAHPQLERGPPPARAHYHGIAVARRAARGVVGVDFDERLRLGGQEVLGLGGAGHGVPLVGDAPGREHERKLVVRHVDGLRVVGWARGERVRPASGSGASHRAVGAGVGVPRRAAGGHRPLQRASLREAAVREAGLVAEPAVGRLHVLVEDGGRGAPRELLAVAEGPPGAREDLPVGQGVAGRVDDPPHEGHPALGVRLRSLLLRPLRGREHDVREGARLRRVVGVLDDHEVGAVQRSGESCCVGL